MPAIQLIVKPNDTVQNDERTSGFGSKLREYKSGYLWTMVDVCFAEFMLDIICHRSMQIKVIGKRSARCIVTHDYEWRLSVQVAGIQYII